MPWPTMLTNVPAQWRRDIIVALAIGAGMVLLGAPVGLLWAHISPHVHTVMTKDGVSFTESEPKQFIGSDATFLLLTLGVGIVVAAIVGWLDRVPGPATVVALAAGGCVAAVVAWHIGYRVGFDSFTHFVEHGRVGQHMDAIVRVRAKSIALGWGGGAVIGYGAVVALRSPARRPQWESWYGSSVG